MTGGKECYVQVKSRTSGVPELPGSCLAPRALSGRLTRKAWTTKEKVCLPYGAQHSSQRAGERSHGDEPSVITMGYIPALSGHQHVLLKHHTLFIVNGDRRGSCQ